MSILHRLQVGDTPAQVFCMTLPLKLAPFERYMLVDDRREFPMAFTILLRASGRLDRAAFEQAATQAVERHPFLGAHVEGTLDGKLTWVAAANTGPWIKFCEPDQPLEFAQQEQIDLWKETGLRIWARGTEGTIELRFQFHHSCCDGIGAYRYIEDLLCLYHQRVCPGEDAIEPRPLDPALLLRRTRFGLSWLGLMLRLPIEFWGVVVGLGQFLLIRPVALRSPETPKLTEAELRTQLDCPAYRFDAVEHKRLRELARRLSASVNDLLMSEIVRVMHEWNVALDPRSGRKFYRIMFPVNVRSPRDEQMPAANVIGMLMIDRKLQLWNRRLLWSIKVETGFLRLFRFGMSFARACAVVGTLRGGMKLMSGATRSYVTAVFSNMGRVFHESPLPQREGKLTAGGLVLEAVESGPPVRPFTHAAFSALSYAGDLTLVLVYDRRHFTPVAATQLLDKLVTRLKNLLDGTANA